LTRNSADFSLLVHWTVSTKSLIWPQDKPRTFCKWGRNVIGAGWGSFVNTNVESNASAKNRLQKMTIKTGTLVILFFILGHIGYGQTPEQPKQLRVKGTYVHSPTTTEFPEIIGNYQRQSIYSFDKKKENIGSTYKSGETTLSIHLYPAGDGSEGRLRNQYLQALQDMADLSKNGLHAEQGYKYFNKDGYKVNGFSAVTPDKPMSQFTLFECGQWFFKIRITTSSLDTAQINELEREVLNSFDPTRLVKSSRLNSKADVYFAKAAFRDSLMLGSAMGSALKKISWALDNVDSLERAAGFPDLYLGLQVESLKEFVRFEKRKKWNKQQSTTDYLNELNAIIDSGFLEEFVMEQFDMIMIVPKEVTLDFEGFQKWKETHQTTIDLNQRFYVVSYKVSD